MGDGPFLAALEKAFRQAPTDEPPEAELPVAGSGFSSHATLAFANGDVTADAADALAELADSGRVAVRLACHHRVVVFETSRDGLGSLLAAHPDLPAPGDGRPTVVACPGSTWCRRALVNTRDTADAVRAALRDAPADGKSVCISGCPNGCAHTRVADVGLSGRRVDAGDTSGEGFDVFAAGGMGRTPQLAQLVARAVPAKDAPATVATLLGNGEEPEDADVTT
jgi:sulfite reductase beta subunit-like hemoprotein